MSKKKLDRIKKLYKRLFKLKEYDEKHRTTFIDFSKYK
jgi:hypothetical protein